jgi:hypothetical protein
MPGSGLSARIHRGSHEVGGSCVELAAVGERLIVDFGLPLDADMGDAAATSIVSELSGRRFSGDVASVGGDRESKLSPRQFREGAGAVGSHGAAVHGPGGGSG